ncbi:SpaA isopeptide-forming pilin-related protein [Bacillus anthracis]|nr:SpaA isopeptide-forming pilin-related protein [Bacillus anthracis]
METIVTDDKGEALSKQLPVGSYTLKEVEAPKGYELSSSSVSVDVEANKVVTVDVVNKKIPEKVTGQFEIVKVDAEDKAKVLSDAEFEVYKDGKKVETLRTDKTGKVISQKLEPGTYTLKETKAPQGYKLLKEEIEVVVEANKVVQVQVENAKELGSLQVIKKDAESGKVLEGAEFKLKNEAGQVVGETKTTNKDGIVKFENLVPGKYTLEETKAPEGYKAVEVTVEVNVVANEVVKQVVTNEKVTGQFEVVKVDANDKTKLLSGAEFEVYKDGKKVAELKTDESGKVMSPKLPLGEYTVKETKAPAGYKLSDKEWKVTIQNEKEVVKVEAENEKILGSLQIIKMDDKDQTKRLAGAEFTLKDVKGNVVKEGITTDKSGTVKVDGLVPGEYTLEETKAPEGYKALEVTIEVNVVANEVVKQDVLNEKVKEEITGQLEITKVDANDINKKLAGAVFEIWKDGTKIDTLTSDENGKAISKELDPGDYILKEVQAPEGYELSDKEIEFTISNQKFEVVKLQITNKKETSKGPENPGEETENPGEETENPGEETEKPGEETEKPGEETEKPGEETEKPGEETEKPGEETEKPGEETEKPGEETEKPGEETEKPGEETEKPGEETEKPGEETEKPGEETEKPGEETEKPGEETEKPGEETEKPGEETEKPGEETEKPGEETEKPGEETEKPGEETEKPGEETEKPGEETEKPGEETEKPGEETEKPGEETEKPGEETEKPGEETEKPGGETEKPGKETEKPGEGMENPDKETENPTLPEKGQGTSHAQQLPATGHDMNYLPFIGFALVLLGIRLRFMTKNN